MEETHQKVGTLFRLGICLGLSIALYYGGEKVCTAHEIPLWEKHRPWLEENRVQSIVTLTALLFGLSLILFPSKEEEEPSLDCDDFSNYEPCQEVL